MKTRYGLVLFGLILLFCQFARAADSDVTITAEKKLIHRSPGNGFQPNSKTGKKTEDWAFTVKVENQTFQTLENLDVKYIIFYKHEELGVKAPPQKKTKSGTYSIASIDSLAAASFDTDSVSLTRAYLIGSNPDSYAYFGNGAKPNAADTLTGIWVRIYKDGNLFAEYAYPAGLTSSETWQ